MIVPKGKEVKKMKILLFAILGVFFTALWCRDFFAWAIAASRNPKEYYFRLADLTLTSILCVVLVAVVGRCA
jgi:hypothetical protein